MGLLFNEAELLDGMGKKTRAKSYVQLQRFLKPSAKFENIFSLFACSWTYKLIGDYLENYPGAKDQDFYGDWVRQYMSDSYRTANDLMIDMFDRFSDGCTEEEFQNLEHIIYACTQYEYMFWNMA